MSRYTVGAFLQHGGKEWVITAKGDWGVRCERGFGPSLSVIVIPWEELLR